MKMHAPLEPFFVKHSEAKRLIGCGKRAQPKRASSLAIEKALRRKIRRSLGGILVPLSARSGRANNVVDD